MKCSPLDMSAVVNIYLGSKLMDKLLVVLLFKLVKGFFFLVVRVMLAPRLMLCFSYLLKMAVGVALAGWA